MSLPCLALLGIPACGGDDSAEFLEETGDGDGDPTTGDGDGDPTTGDGDGDPTTGDGDGDPTTGDGDGDAALSFETDVFPIIQNSCSCHSAGAGGLVMPDATTAYANLVGIPAVHDAQTNRVEPGDSANSFFYQKIMGTQTNSGPTNANMPKGLPALSDADQMLIAEWIDAGAAF